ncbi:accessory gene regulator B family protein [Brevibacillus sp. SYP-B805]|uniref:accessory gene regulator B family protein n=1 Tax=Brevibacillus sp. SYP-B805 TaxID=1578199 RepID=UPI0013EDA7A6|nr:accessory gene regulator B family protein [Brevibacillus sp. SYP-B805]NGQ95690.1 accessory gene regulator B family protein [Brevibacillus sp. SYP-B805]
MSWTEKVSIRLAKRIIPEDSPYSVDQISHGIEITIINLLNAAALVLLSSLAGVLFYTIALTALYFLHRSFTGGIHFKNVWTCLILGVSTMTLAASAISHLSVPRMLSYGIVLSFFAVSFFINYRYAPAEHTYVSTKESIKKACRIIILNLLIFGCVIAEFLIYFGYSHLAFLYAFAALLQSLHLLPTTFRLVAQIEKNMERVGSR